MLGVMKMNGDNTLKSKVEELRKLSPEDQITLAKIAMKELDKKGINSTNEQVFAKAYELYSLNNKRYS